MRKPASPLLAIFRTPLQGDVLAYVYLREDTGVLSISDLARELGEPVASVHREARRLAEAGLLTETRQGRSVLVAPPQDELVTRPLTELLAVTFGPLPVLTELLAGIPGIQHAYIYGSWAARYRGEPGRPPADVDVLVVGTADADALDAIAEQAEDRLHREVNIRRIQPARWEDPGADPFLTHVQSRPLVELDVAAQKEDA